MAGQTLAAKTAGVVSPGSMADQVSSDQHPGAFADLHLISVEEMPSQGHASLPVPSVALRQWAIEQAIKSGAGHPVGMAQQILDFVLNSQKG
jgi:hypothetical protein